ncbi:MAG: hypothetical protein GY866_00970, partial [Proteobacteria bacterium]|nr:hypothetical protein [Pseudomonadota bacterium]
LHLASVGTFLHTGLKLPWGTWFGLRKGDEDEIPDVKEPPFNMLLAMGIGAFLCILTGVYPQLLYDILPYPVDFHPYQASHVVSMLQLLLLTLAAFWIYVDKLGGEPFVSLDTDWVYRIFGRILLRFCEGPLNAVRSNTQLFLNRMVDIMGRFSRNPYLPLELFWELSRGKPVSLKSLADRPDNHSAHRIPVGVGACISLVLLCGLVYLGL